METRFYCENCGNDVPFNAEVCPSCGKVFSAVKCPVCLFEGKPGVFLQGCPECGYMSPQIEGLSSQSGGHSDAARHSDAASGNKKDRRARRKPNRGKSRLLPRWVYSGGIMLLLVILLILLIALFRTW